MKKSIAMILTLIVISMFSPALLSAEDVDANTVNKASFNGVTCTGGSSSNKVMMYGVEHNGVTYWLELTYNGGLSMDISSYGIQEDTAASPCVDNGAPVYDTLNLQNFNDCGSGCRVSEEAFYGFPMFYEFTTIEGCSTIQLTLAGTNGINPDMIVKYPAAGDGQDLTCSDYDNIMANYPYGSKSKGTNGFWFDLSASYESEIIDISDSVAGHTYQIVVVHGDSDTKNSANYRLEYKCF